MSITVEMVKYACADCVVGTGKAINAEDCMLFSYACASQHEESGGCEHAARHTLVFARWGVVLTIRAKQLSFRPFRFETYRSRTGTSPAAVPSDGSGFGISGVTG